MAAKHTRLLPALIFGVVAFIAFKTLADRPPPDGGGPPIIDLSPLFSLGIGLAATIACLVSLAWTSKPAPRSDPNTATPVLPVAKASRSRRTA